MKDLKISNERNLDFNSLKDQFINYIDVSDKTIETYSGALRNFIKYMQRNNIKNPTRDNIIAYREYLKDNYEINSVNGIMIALRQFFKFLEYSNIYKNITENVKGIKVEEYHKWEYLTLEECKKVLNESKNLREKTLFILATTCGLRANEVVNIRLKDFTLKGGKHCLYILGKDRDGKQDYVVVSDETFSLIQEYVLQYNIQDYLFVSNSNHNKGGKLSTCTLRRIINAMYERVGLKDEHRVFHSLRHSFATLSLENGVEFREVSKGLRHKNTKTTEIYVHDLEKVHNKCADTMLGFREDFDWGTRFDLKTNVGEYQVSTVDLGLDHSFGIGKPLYYETMIFKIKNNKIDFDNSLDYQVRYSTEEEAREGHKKAIEYVKQLKGGVKDE